MCQPPPGLNFPTLKNGLKEVTPEIVSDQNSLGTCLPSEHEVLSSWVYMGPLDPMGKSRHGGRHL